MTPQEQENKTQSFELGNTQIECVSEVIEGELFDTKVSIGNETLCFVAGSDLEYFILEMEQLIQKYRI
ncbi:hypothetical protein ACE193_15425 [Bernardetia sp. OM2101]|uniref:hypothetical protein n=1 Tax=Bernardetia sp. OM2101 TaxID=3344876 RepID=UPI0035CE9D80